MTRSPIGLLASGAALLLTAGCAGGPGVSPRFPLTLHAATVANGEEHPLTVDGNTVSDGSVRIIVKANQAGMILTIQDQAGTDQAVVWDDATLARDDGAPRRIKVGSEARVNARSNGEVNHMRASRSLFRQTVPARGSVVAYAPGQFRIPGPIKGCDAVLNTEFELSLPVESGHGVRRYTLTLRPEWFESYAKTGVRRCGPVPSLTP